MSALLEQLSSQGITEEDLEKAASVHLFQKTAAAEGIDLDSMSDDQQAELFDYFEANVLPEMVSKQASTDPIQEKLASLSEDDVYFLFEKQAAYEGFDEYDLEALSEEKLASAFEHFVGNILPDMAANDWDPVDYGDAEKVAEASAKLAEAEILGRHMADAFHDQLDKLADAKMPNAGGAKYTMDTLRDAAGNPESGVSRLGRAAESVGNAARRGAAWAGKNKGKAALLGAGGLVAAGGGAYGGKKMYDHMKKKKAEKSKEASAFEALALEKAASILEANGIDPYTGEPKVASIDDALDARAAEILLEAGYTFE